MTTDPRDCTDPYRQEGPTHPVDQLRQMALAALEGLREQVRSAAPSTLQDLSVALTTLGHDVPKTGLDVLQALRDLAQRSVPGLALLQSQVFHFPEQTSVEHAIYPSGSMAGGRYFLPKAMRIDLIGELSSDLAPEIEIMCNEYTLISRCNVQEFLEMTPFEGCVASMLHPLIVRLFACPKAPEIRLVFRGEEQAHLGIYPTMYPGRYISPYDRYRLLSR